MAISSLCFSRRILAALVGMGLIVIGGVDHTIARQAQSHPDFSGTWTLGKSSTALDVQQGAVHVGPATAGGQIAEPRKIKNASPVYPVAARAARITGMVVIEATIDTTGRVAVLELLQSVPGLDQAALEAVSQWEYTPTLVNGVPVSVLLVATVNFSLDGKTPSPKPGRSGPPSFEIAQDEQRIKTTYQIGSTKLITTYLLDGKRSANQGRDYVSHWEGEKLVTDITPGDPKSREQRETMWIDHGKLVIERSFVGLPTLTRATYTRTK